jgi:N-acetyl-beta-hexosaminidase
MKKYLKSVASIIILVIILIGSFYIISTSITTTYAADLTSTQSSCLDNARTTRKNLVDGVNEEYKHITDQAQQALVAARDTIKSYSDPAERVKARYDALRIFHKTRQDVRAKLKESRVNAFKQYQQDRKRCLEQN